MFNKIFGEMSFDSSWEKKETIKMFEREYNIAVIATAYYESEGITPDQEESYAFFEKNKNEIFSRIQTKLLQNVGNKDKVLNIFTPSTLLIQKDGSAAILFDKKNSEDGTAFTISLDVEEVAQDSFL